MDGKTRATLWIAGLVLGTYFLTTFLNCALDTACQFRCASTAGVNTAYRGGSGCAYQRTPPKPILLDKGDVAN
jgi:hypothetical protein